jgi:hypothetical protein
VDEIKDKESKPDSESDSENTSKRQIIDADPTAIVATAAIQPEELTNLEEGECLFHSQKWVKGTPLHFIVDSGSQKNLISAEVVRQLELSTTPTPQPYNIGWFHQGRDFRVSQHCQLSYDIQPFKDEVLCDVSPLDVCDVLLSQPYMWKYHVVYDSRPRSVIVSLGYYKIHLLHNLFKRRTEVQCNHYILAPSTFYLTEAGQQGCRKAQRFHLHTVLSCISTC